LESTLRLAHLYPKLMNIYGDRGNILCLERRCRERGIAFEVTELDLGAKRFIGNVVVEWRGGTLAGFENHGGRTYLDEGVEPLGRVVSGFGNNGADGGEGAVRGNAFGTYLHGSLLPKNPRFADHLIPAALLRRHKKFELALLDDRVEEAAHAAAVRLATRRGIISV